ncbi:hypothetical protein XELAEV_18041673mg [Xenopus laevis]|uniref:Uncharacterized protein n=1 Tax=Xenopus laevis TaxID=8355 RepID=A0A974H5B5_XENLA|nr:hypothetical protein XELAEV_18041673mg [Xenopus laevis]
MKSQVPRPWVHHQRETSAAFPEGDRPSESTASSATFLSTQSQVLWCAVATDALQYTMCLNGVVDTPFSSCLFFISVSCGHLVCL